MYAMTTRECAARDCSVTFSVPPVNAPGAGWRKQFCSDRCRRRERDRRLNGYRTRAEQIDAVSARRASAEAIREARRIEERERRETRALIVMLREVERLKRKVEAAPCPCEYCGLQRWRERRSAVLDRNRAFVDAAKGDTCLDCGHRFPLRQLHFHHRDPATKLFQIAVRRKSLGCTIEELAAEIAKCDVLCATCHQAHHQE